jgi:hypothetical protein
MDDISKKSTAVLIDELCTTLIKCFMAQETVMNEATDEQLRWEAAVSAQKLNARRNQLTRAIDASLGQGDITPTEKTYGNKDEPVS